MLNTQNIFVCLLYRLKPTCLSPPVMNLAKFVTVRTAGADSSQKRMLTPRLGIQ